MPLSIENNNNIRDAKKKFYYNKISTLVKEKYLYLSYK